MTLLLGVLVSSLAGQTAPASPPAPPADYMIVVWYERSHPLETFRYEVYDVRKNQFTQAVERWIDDVAARFPHYEAYARPFVLSREKGISEKLEIGQAVTREFIALGASRGHDFGGLGQPPASPSRTRIIIPGSPPSRTRALHPLPTVGTPGLLSTPGSGIPFPTPMPYPRPHP